MKTIYPTSKEVLKRLKDVGCVWCGGNGDCQCFSRQILRCYNIEKEEMKRIDYEGNYPEPTNDWEKGFDLFFKELEEV